MAKYKNYSYDQGVFPPVFFDKQILSGTFEYCLNYLVDNKIDLTVFDCRYNNDESGAPAYDPRILLKVILFAYSRGITSSRKMAQCCGEDEAINRFISRQADVFKTTQNGGTCFWKYPAHSEKNFTAANDDFPKMTFSTDSLEEPCQAFVCRAKGH